MTKPAMDVDETLSALWIKSRVLHEACVHANEDEDGCDGDACDEAIAIETTILQRPIQSVEDVMAKLRTVQLAFHEGPRADGAENGALEQILKWLDGQAAR
jgi:hypothetical protein